MLSPGQLNEKGVRNLTILGTLIQWQKLDYDFKWTNQVPDLLWMRCLDPNIFQFIFIYIGSIGLTLSLLLHQEFPTDLRLIVVSEGKSILPSDFQLHLKTENDVDVDQYDAQLNQV